MSYSTGYYDANSIALKQVQNTMRSFEYALQDIGWTFKEISVGAGKYIAM